MPNNWSVSTAGALDEISEWSLVNNMKLNPTKTKELYINFAKNATAVTPLTMNDCEIEQVPCAKLLGLHIAANLKWNYHVDQMLKKASQRLYFLGQLRRSGASTKHLITTYKTLIRPVSEYACEAWHPGLTKTQSNDIESIQKRALKIIFPNYEYNVALSTANLQELSTRRNNQCKKLFEKIKDPDNRINHLLPAKQNNDFNLRHRTEYPVPTLRTSRAEGSFINFALLNFQN